MLLDPYLEGILVAAARKTDSVEGPTLLGVPCEPVLEGSFHSNHCHLIGEIEGGNQLSIGALHESTKTPLKNKRGLSLTHIEEGNMHSILASKSSPATLINVTQPSKGRL